MAKGKPKKALTDEEKIKIKAAKRERDNLKRLALLEAAETERIRKYHQDVREHNISDFVLSESIKSFDVMRHGYLKQQADLSIQEKWNDYVNCVNLPSGSDAPNLRAFLDAWKNELKQQFETHISWVVDVDERSLLQQDRSKKNMSFKKLKNDQPIIADSFIHRMRNAFALTLEMEKVINSSHLPLLKTELIQIREMYRKQMKSTIDLFTYRLLTNIERDMSSVDAHKAKYNYATELFRSSVWTSRPVPQIGKCWLVETTNLIEFPLFQSSLICPEQVEIDGYSFRSLWTNYDHFSDSAPSFNLNTIVNQLPDLRAANNAEWLKKEELREIKLNEMIRVRTEWEEEEKKRIANEEAVAKAKKSEKEIVPKKKKKKVKERPEPPPANKDTIVSIDDEFNEYDDEQLSKFQQNTSPYTLNLQENEVNLRNLYMLGGIFEFDYLKRPCQYNQISDNVLLRLDNGTILDYVDFSPKYQNDPTFYDELIEIEVKLNDQVCWWTTPIVAYWEPWEKSDQFIHLSPALQHFHLNYDKYIEKIRSRLFTEPIIKVNTSLIKSIQDFKVDTFPHDIGFVEFIKQYLIPRIPLSYKFKSELDQEREIIRKENLRRKEIEMEHQEEKLRKRQVFEEDMRIYKKKADMKRNEMIDKRRFEMQEEREQTRIKLVNQGENDKQIEKHLKFKEETDEKFLHTMDMEELLKYHDYYAEQYNFRFNSDSKSEDSVIEHTTPASKTLPADMFPTASKQLPLRVYMPHHKSICFDCPTIEDNAEIEVDEDADSDHILLSTFLQYLKILHQKSLPHFEKHRLIGVNESVNRPINEGPIEALESTNVTTPKRRSLSLVKLLVKATKPKSRGTKFSKSFDTDKSFNMDDSKTIDSKRIRRSSSLKAGNDSISLNTINEKPARCKVPPMQLISHPAGHWKTTGIYFTEFNPTTGYIKYKTSKLGPFGFAMPKYCNYPLKYWEVYPSSMKKNSVLIKIIGNFCEIKFEITEDGYLIERILPNKINFEPSKMVMSYEALTKFLSETGIINFPLIDAGHYINGVVEKHFLMETHNLESIAQFTLSYYFKQSTFNTRLDRRSAIFASCQLHEDDIIDVNKLEFEEILITPLRVNTVKTVEVPIKNSLETELHHHLVPEEQEFYPDVLTMLTSLSDELSIKRNRQMKETIKFNVARLLCAIRPLSFTA